MLPRGWYFGEQKLLENTRIGGNLLNHWLKYN